MNFKVTHKLPVKRWAGFVDGRVDLEYYRGPSGTIYGSLYKRKSDAPYQDVRRIEIRQVRK